MTNDEPTELQNDSRCLSLQAIKVFEELRENCTLTDVTIQTEDGGTFQAHKVILSSCSSYFKALFTSKLNENKNKFLVKGVSIKMMKLIIDYAYSRKLNINDNNVYCLLKTADFLNILSILKKCCDYIASKLSPNNCIGILFFSKTYFCKELEQTARKYLYQNFTQVAEESDEICQLNIDDFIEILQSDELNVKSEEIVWNSGLKWINHDPSNRKQYICKIMKTIRLGLLDTAFFLEQVKEHPYVVEHKSCRPLIIDTLKFLYNLETITRIDDEISTPEIARPRVPNEILFAIGGWSGGSPTNFIETYDTRADRWIKVEEVDLNRPRAYHGTAVIGYSIYVIGGFDGVDYFNSCRCFNAVTKKWREIAPMNARRCYVSVTILNDVIYAMGGYDGHRRQNTAEKYDYKTNQWSLIAPMNMQRSDASACTLNGKIYIVGGFNGQECMNSAEVYDPELNLWSFIQPMRNRRSGVSCVAYHNQIYVCGGFNGISRMCSGEKFNPTTNEWSVIPDMYNPRSNFAIEVIDDMIFVIGGFNGVSTIFHVECYDEKVNEWYEATDMNIYRSALSACVITGLPNIYDYIHPNREKLMEEKRQRMIAYENARLQEQNSIQNPDTLIGPLIPQEQIHQLNILQQIQNNNITANANTIAQALIHELENGEEND